VSQRDGADLNEHFVDGDDDRDNDDHTVVDGWRNDHVHGS
jgi:hypothetical protein